MGEIGKHYNAKVIALVVSAVFLFTSMLYASPYPGKTLRTLIGSKDLSLRLQQADDAIKTKQVFKLLSVDKWLTVKEINKATDLPEQTIQQVLNFLVSTGVIIERRLIYKINPIMRDLDLVEKIENILNKEVDRENIRKKIRALIPTKELIDRLVIRKYHEDYSIDEFDQETPSHAAYALAILQEKNAVDPLIDLLSLSNAGELTLLTINIVKALAKIGDPRSKYPLGRLLQTEHPECRAAAREALLRIDPQFYYDLQKKTILSVLSAKELELLMQYLKGEDYDTQAFNRVHSKLDEVHAFDTIHGVVNKTGGVKAWKDAPKEKRKNLVSEIRKDYDEYAGSERSSVSRKPGMKKALKSIFGTAIPTDSINKKSKVLMLGIGEGITANLAVQQGIKTIVGLDISDEMLKLAKNGLEKLNSDADIRLIKGDMFDIGELFKNEKFSIITLNNVLIFYPYDDRKYILSETLKLLEKSGYIAICYRIMDEEDHAKRNECLMQPKDYVSLLKEDLGFDDAGYYIGAVEKDDDSDSEEDHIYIVWGQKKPKGKLKSGVAAQVINYTKKLKLLL
ncbi:MAG: methyltransferase domain-containing protein [Candidatus Omnitrophica bacterium]|nr:methyltransferase domain-containing protein [Candidatus Omnitrophota bacterium]